MTASPFTTATCFVAHECAKTAQLALSELSTRYQCSVRTLFGKEMVEDGEVFISSASLDRPCYLRMLPPIPNPKRTGEHPLYIGARPFGWNEGAAGLVVINTRSLASTGRFEGVHDRKFINSLANLVNVRPPLIIYGKGRGRPNRGIRDHKAYFAS